MSVAESSAESPSGKSLQSDVGASAEACCPPKKGRHWYRQWGMPVSTIVLLGVAIAWMRWASDDPLLGWGFVNLVTFALGGAIGLTLLIWFSFVSYFSRQTVLLIVGPLLLGAVGWAASIRQVQFDGDLYPTFFYRWDRAPELQSENTALIADHREFRLQPGDVPAFRGAARDGRVQGPALNQDWSARPPVELWRTSVGAGYASMVIVEDSLITLEQRDENEAITCYEASTGKLRWIHSYPARFYEAMGGLGPRSTPTIDDGLVFAVGALGDVTCLDFFTGELRWQRSLLRELEIPNITWALSGSPLVLGDRVIVNPGGPARDGLMALHRETGETLWQGAGISRYGTAEGTVNHAGYSSPMLLSVADVEQIVIFDGHGLSGHDPDTGSLLWHFPYLNNAGVNVAQPILLESGRELFISASYGMGSALVEVSRGSSPGEPAWQVRAVWQDATVMRSKFSNPVYHNRMVYGLDEGILQCIDPRTGQKQWKGGRYKHGQVLLVNEQLLVMSEEGDLVLVAADPARFQEITRLTVLPGARVWNPHVLADGIVYVRDDKQMAAYNLKP